MAYKVTKHYGHELGLSACFRQWRASSHCNKLHGYALAFTLVFEAEELNDNGWVIDFGSLKTIKEYLVESFDHRLLIAGDDPMLEKLIELDRLGIADCEVWPGGVGCEKFARHIFSFVRGWLRNPVPSLEGYHKALLQGANFGTLVNNPRIVSVTCHEHGANSATYYGD